MVDIEYSWNFFHQDLPMLTLVGLSPIDPFSDPNHGTAVLGQIVSVANGTGTTGLTPGATAYVAAANTVMGYNVAAAIYTALSVLGPGDIILIEQQIAGPNYTGFPSGTQFGLVPVEWSKPTYDAIVIATGNGVMVVEAAGNGQQNLDDVTYSTGNGGHWPFLAENDSGAIIVGAGSASTRSRLSFSNYGMTVDLQGWGHQVCTTGYGDLYNAEGPTLYFTSGFSGTSSASPIVAGACALMQSLTRASVGGVFSPQIVRDALVATGTPQSGTQHIGPLPDVPSAFASLSLTAPHPFSLVSPEPGLTNVSQAPSFSWSTAVAAQGYRLRVDDDPLFGGPEIDVTTESPSHAHTGTPLPLATLFHWNVQASNLLGTIDSSPPTASFTTLSDPPGSFSLMSPPDGQTGVGLQPTLEWTPAALADSYQVRLDDDSDFSSPLIDSVRTSPLLTVPPDLLQGATTYHWNVEAKNAIGATASDPASATFRTIGTLPGPFNLLSPPDGLNISTTTPTLTWSASSGAETYRVQWDLDVNFADPDHDVAGLTTTSYTVPAGLLSSGFRYYWRVFSVNENGSVQGAPPQRSFGVLVPPCLGDANRDNVIDFNDVLAVLGAFGTTYAGSTGFGDANFDSVVNFHDVLTVLGNFLAACPM